MSEKPLHVRVAEALGWESVWNDPVDDSGWLGVPRGHAGVNYLTVPRYDTDWAETGPLIERYSIALFRSVDDGLWSAAAWRPNDSPENRYDADDPSPLIAVCNLILALAAAGKLEPK